MNDPYNLQRFVDAQGPVYDEVRAELLRGRKSTHWMWYIFPQIEGLGQSAMSRKFAISSLSEAQAYLQHPIPGARIRECTHIVNALQNRSAHQIFGSPDDMKFQSCMTLFCSAAADSGIFREALEKYFAGKSDQKTLDRL